jgi:hypothetical protein
MNKFRRSFITLESTIQRVTLVGVIVFLGYLGFAHYHGDRASSSRSNSPTQQK